MRRYWKITDKTIAKMLDEWQASKDKTAKRIDSWTKRNFGTDVDWGSVTDFWTGGFGAFGFKSKTAQSLDAFIFTAPNSEGWQRIRAKHKQLIQELKSINDEQISFKPIVKLMGITSQFDGLTMWYPAFGKYGSHWYVSTYGDKYAGKPGVIRVSDIEIDKAVERSKRKKVVA